MRPFLDDISLMSLILLPFLVATPIGNHPDIIPALTQQGSLQRILAAVETLIWPGILFLSLFASGRSHNLIYQCHDLIT